MPGQEVITEYRKVPASEYLDNKGKLREDLTSQNSNLGTTTSGYGLN